MIEESHKMKAENTQMGGLELLYTCWPPMVPVTGTLLRTYTQISQGMELAPALGKTQRVAGTLSCVVLY